MSPGPARAPEIEALPACHGDSSTPADAGVVDTIRERSDRAED